MRAAGIWPVLAAFDGSEFAAGRIGDEPASARPLAQASDPQTAASKKIVRMPIALIVPSLRREQYLPPRRSRVC
jgi:hypothetical protein